MMATSLDVCTAYKTTARLLQALRFVLPPPRTQAAQYHVHFSDRSLGQQHTAIRKTGDLQ